MRVVLARTAVWVLLGAGLVDAQTGKIVVTSPQRDDIIHAGDSVVVEFTATVVTGPYDVDLYKAKEKVASWCSISEGCAIDNGSVAAEIPATLDPGMGYIVNVTDKETNVWGASYAFELLPALPSNSTETWSPELRDDVGGEGGTRDMSLGLVIMAVVCGLALVGTLLAACCVTAGRRRLAAQKSKEFGTKDMELGGGVLDRTDDSNLTDSRGFSVGNPLKTRSISGGSFATSPAMRGRAESRGAPSPGRAMAMGEHQRGRSLSRQSSGRQMYSTSNTPGRHRGVGTSASPGHSGRYSYDGSGRGTSRTPGRTPSRGRQMYDHSTSTPTWDERRGRAASVSRSPRMASTRSTSAGRVRRPPRPLSLGPSGEADKDSRPTSMTPGRSSSRSGQAAASSPHILGNRRSNSDRARYHPSRELIGHGQEEGGEEQQVRGEEYGWPRREDGHMMAAMKGVERGRGRQRSAHSKSMHDVSDRDSTGSSGRYDRDRRGRSSSRGRSGTPTREQDTSPEMPSDVSWEELRSTYLKNKSKARVRKSHSLPSYGDAVSVGGRDARPPPPSYSPTDEYNSRHLSIGIPDDHRMDAIRSSKSARSARQMMSTSSRSVGSSKSLGRSPGHPGGSTPGSRAVSARRAARDAQLSAERALAAAAMASRAADLAAQAALDAEAEADQELIGDDSYDEVEMSPPSKSSTVGEVETSSVREKIKVFSGGSAKGSSSGSTEKMGRDGNGMLPGRSPYSRALSRGWSQADEQEVKARAEQSSTRAREALATIGRSASSGSRPDNSWVKDDEVRGPDTAGGSSSEGQGGPLPNDAEQLAMKRKAFVKQYSQGGASDLEDSDYSLHDNAAAVAVAAAFGKVVSSRTAVTGHAGAGAVHSADTSFGDAPGIWSEQEEMHQQQLQRQKDEQRADGDIKGTPKRGRPSPVKLHNSNGNSGGEGHERAAAKMRHAPTPSYDASKDAFLHMSESGSPRAEFA